MANANLQYWQLMSVQAHVSWRLSQDVVVGSPVINGELVPSVIAVTFTVHSLRAQQLE